MISAKARLSPIHAALHHAAERRVTSRGPRRDARKTRRSTASSASTNAANSPHSHELTCIVTPGSQVGSCGEHAVHELNADGPLADRRCDAFDATGANVADREDARDARLEKERRARKRPPDEVLHTQLRPRFEQTPAVERPPPLQPFPVRGRAGHPSHAADG